MPRIIAIALATALLFSGSAVQAKDSSQQAGGSGPIVQIWLPKRVKVGYHMFTLTVNINNPTSSSFDFDGIIKHGGGAWSG